METNDCSLREMLKDFYNRKMTAMLVIIYAYSFVFIGICIFSGVKFFDTADTRGQIMYATLFVVGIQCIGMMKVFAWQLIHRNSIKRQLRELEAKITK